MKIIEVVLLPIIFLLTFIGIIGIFAISATVDIFQWAYCKMNRDDNIFEW